jgi:hypothetical protein
MLLVALLGAIGTFLFADIAVGVIYRCLMSATGHFRTSAQS